MIQANVEDAYLFSEKNRSFLSEKRGFLFERHPLFVIARTMSFVGFNFLIVFILIFVFVFRSTAYIWIFAQNFIVFGAVFGFIFGLWGLYITRKLEREGIVLSGKLIDYRKTLVYGLHGISMGLKAVYEYELPNAQKMTGATLISSRKDRLFKNRPIPPVGTNIAVLYVSKNLNIPL